MNDKNIARGSATRTANMNKRRESIISCAGDLIANEGLDALTLNRIAVNADVTIPTIHNLIGKKSDILERLVQDIVDQISAVLAHQDINEPIVAAETFTDQLTSLFSSKESLYRAAFIAGEQAKLFNQEAPKGLFAQSIEISRKVCDYGINEGYLLGNIPSSILARELNNCQRLARHDWMNGYIDLATYKNRILTGMYIVFMADASPMYAERLKMKISELTS